MTEVSCTPVAAERLAPSASSEVRHLLKTLYRDGTTQPIGRVVDGRTARRGATRVDGLVPRELICSTTSSGSITRECVVEWPGKIESFQP